MQNLVERRHEIKNTFLGGLSMAPNAWPAVRDMSLMTGGLLYFGIKGLKPLHIWIMVLVGRIVFSLIEYISHRYTFHYFPKKQKFQTGLAVIHIPHHCEPHEGINAGPLTYFPFALIMFGLNWLVVRNSQDAMLLLAGNLLGFMFYEWMHYEMHLGNRKRFYVRYMTALHDYHHDVDWGKNFGVTNPLWDMVFGTYKYVKLEQPAFSSPQPRPPLPVHTPGTNATSG